MRGRIVEHETRGVVLVEGRRSKLGLELDFPVLAGARIAIDRDHVIIAGEQHAAGRCVDRILRAQPDVVAVRIVDVVSGARARSKLRATAAVSKGAVPADGLAMGQS